MSGDAKVPVHLANLGWLCPYLQGMDVIAIMTHKGLMIRCTAMPDGQIGGPADPKLCVGHGDHKTCPTYQQAKRRPRFADMEQASRS